MYHLATDPGETQDISSENPLMFQIMLSAYQAYAEAVGGQQMHEGYSPVKEVGPKHFWQHEGTHQPTRAVVGSSDIDGDGT